MILKCIFKEEFDGMDTKIVLKKILTLSESSEAVAKKISTENLSNIIKERSLNKNKQDWLLL